MKKKSHGGLTHGKIDALESLGFIWDKKNAAKWEREISDFESKYGDLIKFNAVNGTLHILVFIKLKK